MEQTVVVTQQKQGQPRAAHSQALDLLRFPLAIVVLTVHTFHNPTVFVYGKEYTFAGRPLFDAFYNFVYSFLSDYSLMIYFFISGYVFFLGITDFTADVYKRKLRNRVKTLLIPFIVWNVACVLVELSYYFPPLSAMRPGLDFAKVDLSPVAVLQTFWNSIHGIFGNVYEYPAADYVGIYPPQNNSLWFLRALMAMALLTPVLWCTIKRVGICLTCAAYALWAWAYLYGTGYVLEFATALFPFSFGAYMSISGRNMINVFGRYFKLSAVAYIALSAVQMAALYGDAQLVYKVAKVLACPVALVLAYNLSAWLLRRNYCRVVPLLASASFFIYVSHELILGNVKKVLVALIRPCNGVAGAATYILAIAVVAFGLLGVFWLMQRYTPRLLKFVAGRK